MKNLFIIFILVFTLSSNILIAKTLPYNKEEFCKRFDDIETMSDYSSESKNLMSFKNQGGLFNGGVCWWHTRFQRNILYLSIFMPKLPKLSANEVKPLIREIRLGKSIVKIPGFFNFTEFSAFYKNEILKELENWQLYDGVILGAWVDGLRGETKIPALELQNKMDELYQYVELDKKLAYLKLQIKGITSHSWLVVRSKKSSTGYNLGIIDSNNPNMSQNYSFKIGDESFYEKGYGHFVPYLEFKREEERISSVGKAFCNLSSNHFSLDNDNENYQADLNEILSNENEI